MQRHAVRVGCAVLLLAACGSSGSKASTSTSATTGTTPATTTTTSSPPESGPSSSTTPAPVTTTPAACPNTAGSTAPFSSPVSQASALLTAVTVSSEHCTDDVVFAFIIKGGGVPSCTVVYKSGPFSNDASGAAVTVAGGAFVVVRCSPAYGYDFETGKTTYTGPKRIDPTGTNHVRELVETGDFEGVVTWVVGLDVQRPYRAVAQTTPPGVSSLVLTFF